LNTPGRAVELAREHGYARLAVISAVGTRGYYRKRGFADGTLYQTRDIAGSERKASSLSTREV
jgi:elongator complex protein 3